MSAWMLVAAILTLGGCLVWGGIQYGLNSNTPKGGDEWSVRIIPGNQNKSYRCSDPWVTQIYEGEHLSRENRWYSLGHDSGHFTRLGARMHAAERLRQLRADPVTTSEVVR